MRGPWLPSPDVPTALLSVYDKTGITDLAAGLHAAGWRILSSGGTAAAVAATGVPVTDVAELTGLPAILGHRVVTLHPNVHGGILADRDDATHVAEMQQYGIEAIDLVVVNLYPFASDPGIELIDIGGPAMVRAAAKNHAHVGVVVDPADYATVLDEVAASGEISLATRRTLARKAFTRTSAYDAEIAAWLADENEAVETDAVPARELPERIELSLSKVQALRYGENPHQTGARYRFDGATGWWDSAVQHGGKELSYLNLFDAEAAWRLVHRFDRPACVIVKHANPCGVAVAGDITTAYVRANECDPVSAFGGIVAVNGEVTVEMAEALAPVFTEVVVAPAYADGAIDVLTARKNLRVLSASSPAPLPFDMRPIDGGLLVQQPDPITVDPTSWTVPTTAQPTEQQSADLAFAWVVCAAVSSNAIVYCHSDGDGVQQAFGIGAGQQNRVDSARIAARRADGRAAGGVCASDAYFPFRDGLDVVAEAGITAVIQPGGSIRDDEVIAAADEHGIAMIMTGERHFRH